LHKSFEVISQVPARWQAETLAFPDKAPDDKAPLSVISLQPPHNLPQMVSSIGLQVISLQPPHNLPQSVSSAKSARDRVGEEQDPGPVDRLEEAEDEARQLHP
jgi:hypothetical protein